MGALSNLNESKQNQFDYAKEKIVINYLKKQIILPISLILFSFCFCCEEKQNKNLPKTKNYNLGNNNNSSKFNKIKTKPRILIKTQKKKRKQIQHNPNSILEEDKLKLIRNKNDKELKCTSNKNNNLNTTQSADSESKNNTDKIFSNISTKESKNLSVVCKENKAFNLNDNSEVEIPGINEEVKLIQNIEINPSKNQNKKSILSFSFRNLSKNISKNKLQITLEEILKEEYGILNKNTLRMLVDKNGKIIDINDALEAIAKRSNVKGCTNLGSLIFFAFEIETECGDEEKKIKDFKAKFDRFMNPNQVQINVSTDKKESKLEISQFLVNILGNIKLIKELLDREVQVINLEFAINGIIDSFLKSYFLKQVFNQKENLNIFSKIKFNINIILNRFREELLKKRNLEPRTANKLTFLKKIMSFIIRTEGLK